MTRLAKQFWRIRPWAIYGLLLLTGPVIATAGEAIKTSKKLVLIGGGDHPREATQRFLDWADGNAASPTKVKIAIAVWQTSQPESSYQAYRDEYVPILKEMGKQEGEYEIFSTPTRSEMLAAMGTGKADELEAKLLAQLKDTTGVFFSGGDQAEGVKVLKGYPRIAQALREMYERGVVFGGTSAGTALMSNPMLMGDDFDPKKFDLVEGFGLLPSDVLVDQHFLKRQRKHRLGAMMLKAHLATGIGVEEDGAVSVENNRFLTVLGDKVITVLNNHLDTSLEAMDEVSLTAGQRYDLLLHRRGGQSLAGETASAARPMGTPTRAPKAKTHTTVR